MSNTDGIDAPFNRAMDRAIAHDQRQSIPVLDAATTTLIELLTVNARMPYPLHMPLYQETQPGAEDAIRAVGALPGMRLELHAHGLHLWNKEGLLVALLYRAGAR